MSTSMCMFVVDDDPAARKGLVRLLGAASYKVREFASANEFLDAFDPDDLGCIILDARMPGLTGDELQRELKAQNVELPIIVVTADDTAETRRIAQRMKAVGFFRKPVDGMALLDAIEWALWSDKNDNDQSRK